MVIAAGHTIVEPQQRESYLARCMSVVEQARGIAGCLDFAITADPLDPGRVNNFERWESQAAVETFRGSSPSGKQAAAMLSASVGEYDVSDTRPIFERGTTRTPVSGPISSLRLSGPTKRVPIDREESQT
jgi:quinol monooxygenase YgiN